ncbi:MAG: hypothetical protein EOP45_03495 [Sphingobacteriaceae bacterium]|nr:MAG: hypothetical protein EOP45_03495 [Sphingobacteriaceae bacterium]
MSFLLLLGAVTSGQVRLCHQEFYLLNRNVLELREDGKRLSMKEAQAAFTQHKFVPIETKGNELNKGFVSHVYWLAIPLVNLQSKEESLEAGIANAGLYNLEYYLTGPNGTILNQYVTGKSYNYSHRPIANRHYYFPLGLKPYTSAVVFYRIDLCGNGFNAPLRLVSTSFRQRTEASIYLFYAFFCGLLAFVAFFSLIAFFWTRSKIYLYYGIYVISGTLFFLADGDLDYPWLYPHSPGWALIAPSMYGSVMIFFMLLFMSSFLRLKSSRKWLYRLTRVCECSLLVLMLVIPISHSFLKVTDFRTFVYYYGVCAISSACVLICLCVVRRVWDRFLLAYLYGAAILSVLIAVFIYVIHSFNIFSALLPTFNYILYGFLSEITILSVALLYS